MTAPLPQTLPDDPVLTERPPLWVLLAIAVIGSTVAIVGGWLHHATASMPVPVVSPLWMLPFVILLAAIATMPFIARHWWEHNYPFVAIGLGAFVAAYYVFALDQRSANGRSLGVHAMAASAAEYISFIFLIGSLFIVSGGIVVRIRVAASPLANVALLLAGAILANLFGTTGASMLLIRPFLRMNDGRVRPYHVVFFIFIVSNVGGSLTPIGDPPLFLGYLQGVPFWWVAQHCWPIWLFMVCGLLAIFYVLDRSATRRLPPQPAGDEAGRIITVRGHVNLLFIVLIIAGILLYDPVTLALERVFHVHLPARELAMVLAIVGSLAFTPRRVHIENRFNYGPVKEVALLFIGIFLTMVPALNFLHHENAKPPAERRISITQPGQFYFAAGTLSAVLDNAPTYVAFLQSKLGQLDPVLVSRATTIVRREGHDVLPEDVAGLDDMDAQALRKTIASLLTYHGERVSTGTLSSGEVRVGFVIADERLNLHLVAISMGAVLFGAMTYIGNGPNFMVKAIAEDSGVTMPSFFGYVFSYAVPALLPLLIAVWAIFFR